MSLGSCDAYVSPSTMAVSCIFHNSLTETCSLLYYFTSMVGSSVKPTCNANILISLLNEVKSSSKQ